MYHTTCSALAQGLIEKSAATRILELLKRYGFETELPVERKQLLKAVEGDKKRKGKSIHLIYPIKIGDVVDKVVTFAELKTAL